MRGDDHLVGVGARQHRIEEGLGVSETILRYDRRVGHKAVTPAHGETQLAAALNKEERRGRHLQSILPWIGYNKSHDVCQYAVKSSHSHLTRSEVRRLYAT